MIRFLVIKLMVHVLALYVYCSSSCKPNLGFNCLLITFVRVLELWFEFLLTIRLCYSKCLLSVWLIARLIHFLLILNVWFNSLVIYYSLQNRYLIQVLANSIYVSFEIKDLKKWEIKEIIIILLDANKGFEPDNISSTVLVAGVRNLALPLCIILNMSFSCEFFLS